MEKLSFEHVDLIFRHLETRSDVTNFRLVQRSFAEIGRKYLRLDIYVYPSPGSVRRLLEISKKPDIAPLVKTIIFGDGTNIPRPKLDRVRKRFPPGEYKPKDDMPSLLARVYLVHYLQRCYIYQKSTLFTQSIIDALKNLPKLEKIIVGHPHFPPRCFSSIRWEEYLTTEAGYNRDMAALRTFRAIANGVYFSKIKLRSFQYTYLEQIQLLTSIYERRKANYNWSMGNGSVFTRYPPLSPEKAATFVGKNAWPSLYEEFLNMNIGNTFIALHKDGCLKTFMNNFGMNGIADPYRPWIPQRTEALHGLLANVMNHLVEGQETLEAEKDFKRFTKIGARRQPRRPDIGKLVRKYIGPQQFPGVI